MVSVKGEFAQILWMREEEALFHALWDREGRKWRLEQESEARVLGKELPGRSFRELRRPCEEGEKDSQKSEHLIP